MVTDHPRSSSRDSTLALREGEPSADRAGFGTSRKCFRAPRALETRTSVCWSAQSTPSALVAGGIPRRRHHQGREVASCITHIGTRGSRRENCVGGFSSEGSSASHRATAPLKHFQLGPGGPGLAFSMFEGVGRSRRTSGAPSGRGGSSDGRSYRDGLGNGGQGIAAADCGVGGSTTTFGVQPCCCVPSRAVSRRSSSRWCRNAPPNDELAAKKFHSSQLLSEWLCAKHLELRDALEMGDPLIVVEPTRLLAAGAKMQAMSGRKMAKKKKFGMECGRVESAKPPTQGLSPARQRISSPDECVREVENPGPARSRSRIPHGSEAVEFDLTGGDSDDEPTVPPTIGAVPPFPTWVDDSCQTLESQPSTPFVGGAASSSHLLRRGVRNVVPRIHESHPVDGEVPASAQTVVSSEILDALEQDLPVTMPDSDS